MTVERIEFSLVPLWAKRYEDVFPRPYPAKREIPDWYKSMPADASVRTVKNCPPFMEAMTCGYVIPGAVDISLAVDAAGVLTCESRGAVFVQYHSPDQFRGAPFENLPVVKILNPWLIRTPPGYSTLFVPLLNRFGMPLVPLAGLVETDVFYREVNFPTVVTMQRQTKLALPRGTPLVQAIPIKRADFESEVVPADFEKYRDTVQHTEGSPAQNYYKDNAWEKKTYR